MSGEGVDATGRISVPMRWRDLDAQGHVYHGTVLTLLDEARSQWLVTRLDLGSVEAYVIARIEIDYVGEIRHQDTVEVEHRLARLGRSSLTVEEELFVGGDVAVRSVVTLVAWDGEKRASRPFSPPERAALATALN